MMSSWQWKNLVFLEHLKKKTYTYKAVMKHVEELRSFYTEMWGGNNNLIGLKTKR